MIGNSLDVIASSDWGVCDDDTSQMESQVSVIVLWGLNLVSVFFLPSGCLLSVE